MAKLIWCLLFGPSLGGSSNVQCEPIDTRKSLNYYQYAGTQTSQAVHWDPYQIQRPQIHRPTTSASIFKTKAVSLCSTFADSQDVLAGRIFDRSFPKWTIPAAVKPEGPTETKIPGLVVSWGSFLVIRRYMNALYTIKLTMKPAPWIATAVSAIASEFILATAASGTASIKLAANGPMSRSG